MILVAHRIQKVLAQYGMDAMDAIHHIAKPHEF
jgi:hypothetical protein